MRQRYIAKVPLWLESPEAMQGPIAEVLAGEYEAGFSGEGLTILDIGANVGAFSLWADMRWPGSTIHAYEPHPETFRLFQRNVAGRDNITGRNVALSAAGGGQGRLVASYAGDGEAMLSEYREGTFNKAYGGEELTVDLMHPAGSARTVLPSVGGCGRGCGRSGIRARPGWWGPGPSLR